jgi:hypothetical protein
MTLLQPKLIEIPASHKTIRFGHAVLTNVDLEITFQVDVTYLIEISPEDKKPFHLPLSAGLFDQETANRVFNFRRLLSLCAASGEEIFRQIKNVNEKLIFKYSTSFYERANLAIPKNADFMTHRNFLSDVFKDHKLPVVKRLNEKYDIKALMRILYQFILNRNMYTHGELLVRYPQKDFAIEFQRNATEIILSTIDEEVLKSFVQCKNFLSAFLTELHIMLSEL